MRTTVGAIAIAALVAAPAGAQNLHYGMNTIEVTPRIADKMRELGAGVIRVPFGWDLMEPSCKGCFQFTTTDAWRDEARRTGGTIFATLAYAPGWANGGHPYPEAFRARYTQTPNQGTGPLGGVHDFVGRSI